MTRPKFDLKICNERDAYGVFAALSIYVFVNILISQAEAKFRDDAARILLENSEDCHFPRLYEKMVSKSLLRIFRLNFSFIFELYPGTGFFVKVNSSTSSQPSISLTYSPKVSVELFQSV